MTRRICYFVATSLDGYLARPDGSVDWLYDEPESGGDFGVIAFMQRVDLLVMGRSTFDKAIELGGWGPFGDRHGVVFSRTLKTVPADLPVDIVSGDVAPVVEQLRALPGKDIWLLGGGAMVAQFLDSGCLDEVIVAVHPVLLGSGIPLSAALRHDAWLDLQDICRYERGLIQLSYRVRPRK